MNLGQFAVPRKAEIPVGAVGVWQIPSIDVSIPLYQGNNATQQGIVDADDSAMITRYGAGRIIVDHADSKAGDGAWELWRVRLKDVGFLIGPDKTLIYECVQLCIVDVQRTCYTFDGWVVLASAGGEVTHRVERDTDGKIILVPVNEVTEPES